MQLAQGIEEFIRRSEAAFPPEVIDGTLAEQRAAYRALCRAFEAPRPPGLTVTDSRVDSNKLSVPIRIYRPDEVSSPQAGFVYMHGGGWILGDLDSHNGVTADLAVRAGATVVAVDYRLAPEHRYPAAVEDSWAVLQAVTSDPGRFDIDPARVVVGGDSAGGNLAAVLCLKARAAGGPALCGQVLIYPGLGLNMVAGVTARMEDAPLLSNDEALYYVKCYLGGETTTDDPHVAPLLASDLSDLPPAYIMAVEHDPLRADAEAYHQRLLDVGASTELAVAPGLVHGCLRARGLSPQAEAAFAEVCAATRRLLAP